MKVSLPYWQGRISPVFDEASCLVLVELHEGREMRREMRTLIHAEPWQRVREMIRTGTQVLICGMISRSLEMALSDAGMLVIPCICGPVEDVLSAFINGQLDRGAYTMPGCRWKRGNQVLQPGKEEHMPRGDGTGPPGGGGRRGGGRMGGPMAGGPGGACVCPRCGSELPHAAGQPCNTRTCPKCGAPMARK
jgi:predicted Fe-Mo cluster-binding NifX family protein